jgi:hypothetical protein
MQRVFVQSKPSSKGDAPSTGVLQRRESGQKQPAAVPLIVQDVLRSPGQPLDAATRAFMEPRFGHDFSKVRIHADAKAAESAQKMNALAYTAGRDVVFGAGRYATQTTTGRMLLAHELTHVVQQQNGRVPAAYAKGSLVTDRQLEQEADDLAAEASRGESLDTDHRPNGKPVKTPGAMTFDLGNGSLRLQRKEAPEKKPPPSRMATDFVPNHSFYELLAHEFAYQGNLAGKFLYRARQSQSPGTQPLLSGTPATAGKQSSHPLSADQSQMEGIPGVTPGVPNSLKDGFCFSSNPPDLPPLIPMVGGENPPLFYLVQQMPGSDPLNQASGFAAFYLQPLNKDGPKIIVFRGTDPKAPDIAEDASAKGIGKHAFDQHRPDIKATLKLVAASPPSTSGVVLIGHSLGGALAQWTAADPEFTGLVDTVVTFNSPGINKEAVRDFTKTSAKSKKKPEIYHYVTRGDVVSTAGDMMLPGTVTTMESNATRELERMLENDQIKVVQESLPTLLGLLANLAVDNPPPTRLAYIVEASAKLYRSGAIDAFKMLGPLMGALHSERLLRASQIQPEQLWSPPWFATVEPLSADVRALAQETGEVHLTVKNTSNVLPSYEAGKSDPQAKIELGRKLLGDAFGKDVYRLFNQTIPFIKSLEKNLPVAIGIELMNVSLLRLIAKDFLPLLEKLMISLSLAGGLENLIKTALQYQPKQKSNYKTSMGVSDKTRFVPSQETSRRAQEFLKNIGP